MHTGLLNSSQTKNTLVLSLLSAMICGGIHSEWVFWIPGAVFGLLFAIANFRSMFKIGLYTLLSSAIYIGAVETFFEVSGGSYWDWVGAFLAGVFGAFMLALITNIMSKTPLVLSNEFRSTIIGGMTGLAFVQLFSLGIASNVSNSFGNDANWYWVLNPAAFAVWQVPVAWSITTSIQPNTSPLDVPPASQLDVS